MLGDLKNVWQNMHPWISPLFSSLTLHLSGILWKESSSTSPDPFQMSANPSTVAGTGTPTACPNSFLYIPNLSPDGIKGLPVPVSTSEFYSTLCGALIGHDATSVSLALASKSQLLFKNISSVT